MHLGKVFWSILVSLAIVNTSFAQSPKVREVIDNSDRPTKVISNPDSLPKSSLEQKLQELSNLTSEEFSIGGDLVELKTPQSEVEDAIVFLSKINMPEEEKIYIRFFTTYAIPKELREDRILTLSFVLHSLIGPSNTKNKYGLGGIHPLAIRDEDGFKTYKLVPNSDTLWWIDLRDYNWSPQAWEFISLDDGYFAEPVVSHDRNSILRLLSGNAILRADWFIVNSTDTARQQDVDIEQDFYFALLYANSEKPKNVDEWRKSWTLDLKKSQEFGNEYASLVTKSQAVGKYNRMLFGYRTELGYLYESYDVKNLRGKRDYVESFFLNKNIGGPPDISDAGELFATNHVGMQVYALRDDKGNMISFGDPTVVRHHNDVIGDVRVRNAHSCIDCHAAGPLPAENTINEFIKSQSQLYSYDKFSADRVNRNYLNNKFEESIQENQKFFAKSLKKINGLDPEENNKLYLDAVRSYETRVDLKTAAFECGVTEEEFKETVLNSQYKFGGRLKLLVTTGEPIPRDTWDSPGKDGIPGQFQQAMIMLNGLTIIEEEHLTEENVTVLQTIKETKFMVGSEKVADLSQNETLLFTGKIVDGWAWVYRENGQSGYVWHKNTNEVIMDGKEVREKFIDAGEKVLSQVLDY